MTISPFLPLAISTGSTLALDAASKITTGLSSFAEALAKGGETSEDETAARRAGADSKLAKFYESAAAALREAGVDLSFPVTLESDIRGRLRVRGAHHQQDAIRQVLTDNPDLTNEFHALADDLRPLEGRGPSSQLRLKLTETAPDVKFR